MNNEIYKSINNIVKKEVKSDNIYKLIFTTIDNKDIEYEILATFRSKKTNKIYYIMTDNTIDKDNKLIIAAFYTNYNENSKKDLTSEIFYPVIDDNELQMVYDVFNNIKTNSQGDLNE